MSAIKQLLIVAALLLGLVLSADAHPGRLNTDGCHHVRKEFVYKSGKVVRPGEYHCHRALLGKPFKLDGSEVLMDRKSDVERDEVDDKDEAQ